MAGETVLTITGNLTADPELRFSASGTAVANFTVASTPRSFDKNKQEWVDGEALFMRCTVWKQPGENVAESLRKGMRVVLTGRLKSRSYETKEGEKRTVMEMEVDEIGPSLRYATAVVTRNPSGSSGSGGFGQPQQAQQGGWGQPPQAAQRDPWAAPGEQQRPTPPAQGQQQSWGNQPPPAYDEPPF